MILMVGTCDKNKFGVLVRVTVLRRHRNFLLARDVLGSYLFVEQVELNKPE